MTPEELAQHLARIGWSARQLAKATGRPGQRGHDWTSGSLAVPEDVAAWVRKASAWMLRNPPPKRE